MRLPLWTDWFLFTFVCCKICIEFLKPLNFLLWWILRLVIHEKQFFSLLETQAARKKKSDPPVSLLKQLFLKIIIPYQKQRHQSDPESDPESNLGFVNGRLHGRERTLKYGLRWVRTLATIQVGGQYGSLSMETVAWHELNSIFIGFN